MSKKVKCTANAKAIGIKSLSNEIIKTSGFYPQKNGLNHNSKTVKLFSQVYTEVWGLEIGAGLPYVVVLQSQILKSIQQLNMLDFLMKLKKAG
ncbi:MAG: hypothetical protein ABSF65_06530 [Candidatus Bathyarchaeia archaeon]|jgi:hypothetical protein